MRPTRSTLRALERIATPEQMQRLLVALRAIRMPHPAPIHPDARDIAALIAGRRDPLDAVGPSGLDDEVYREAWRLALAALRVAAVAAPTDEQHRVVAALAARMARLTDRVAGVSNG